VRSKGNALEGQGQSIMTKLIKCGICGTEVAYERSTKRFCSQSCSDVAKRQRDAWLDILRSLEQGAKMPFAVRYSATQSTITVKGDKTHSVIVPATQVLSAPISTIMGLLTDLAMQLAETEQDAAQAAWADTFNYFTEVSKACLAPKGTRKNRKAKAKCACGKALVKGFEGYELCAECMEKKMFGSPSDKAQWEDKLLDALSKELGHTPLPF